MSISVVFTESDTEITGTLDHGSVASGSNSTAKTIYLSLDGAENPINNFRLYLDAMSGTYSGSATAAADKTEIIGWGDNSTAATFGGVQFNFLATTSFPSSGWGTYASKSPTGGQTVRTGVGDSSANGIVLPTTTSSTDVLIAGYIPIGTPTISFQMRVLVPSSGATTGTRQFDIKGAFTYTS